MSLANEDSFITGRLLNDDQGADFVAELEEERPGVMHQRHWHNDWNRRLGKVRSERLFELVKRIEAERRDELTFKDYVRDMRHE